MALSANPASTMPFSFQSATGERLSLRLRVVTVGQAAEYRQLLDVAAAAPRGQIAPLREALAIGIVSPTFDHLAARLSAVDMWTLATVWLDALSPHSPATLAQVYVAANYVCGRICRDCRAGLCSDAPRAKSPLMLACPVCEDTKAAKTCKNCGGRGKIEITDCPKVFVGHDVWEMIRLANFAKDVALPVAGGVLDQADSFMTFLATYRNAIDKLKVVQDG